MEQLAAKLSADDVVIDGEYFLEGLLEAQPDAD